MSQGGGVPGTMFKLGSGGGGFAGSLSSDTALRILSSLLQDNRLKNICIATKNIFKIWLPGKGYNLRTVRVGDTIVH